jgi:hypothetical protein
MLDGGASPHGEHDPHGLEQESHDPHDPRSLSQQPQPVIARPANTSSAANTKKDLFILLSEKRNLRWLRLHTKEHFLPAQDPGFLGVFGPFLDSRFPSGRQGTTSRTSARATPPQNGLSALR